MPLPSQRPSHEPAGDPEQFRILAVCTGNLCRSPTLEQLLRRRLPEAFPGVQFSVGSAGTYASPGQPMDALAVREVNRLGVPHAGEHVARRLTEGQVDEADLILGLAREHRSAVVRLVPRANGRAFTLLEFAHIVTFGGGEPDATVGPAVVQLRRLIGAAHSRRGQLTSRARIDLDVVDPHRRDVTVYRDSAHVINRAVDDILGAWTRLLRSDE